MKVRAYCLRLIQFLAVVVIFAGCGEARHDDRSGLGLSSLGDGFELYLGNPQLYSDAMNLLDNKCAACHRPGGSGDSYLYDVSDVEGMLEEYDSGGRPMIFPGDAGASGLFHAVDNDSMPIGSPLSSVEKDLLSNWINSMGFISTKSQ